MMHTDNAYTLDLRDVRGQTGARRALEIAAAGGHHLLMMGPPGCGKSMLARRLLGTAAGRSRGRALSASRTAPHRIRRWACSGAGHRCGGAKCRWPTARNPVPRRAAGVLRDHPRGAARAAGARDHHAPPGRRGHHSARAVSARGGDVALSVGRSRRGSTAHTGAGRALPRPGGGHNRRAPAPRGQDAARAHRRRRPGRRSLRAGAGAHCTGAGSTESTVGRPEPGRRGRRTAGRRGTDEGRRTAARHGAGEARPVGAREPRRCFGSHAPSPTWRGASGWRPSTSPRRSASSATCWIRPARNHREGEDRRAADVERPRHRWGRAACAREQHAGRDVARAQWSLASEGHDSGLCVRDPLRPDWIVAIHARGTGRR